MSTPARVLPAGPHPAGTPAAPDLSDEALAVVTAQVAATAARYDRLGVLPVEGIDVVHRAGLLGLGVAPAHGGPGVGLTDLVRVARALGAGDPAVALITVMTVLQHRAQPVARTYPAGLYARILEESGRRPVLLNAVRAEPELGAPARGGLPATTVRRTPDGWRVRGRKAYATGSTGLDYHAVWAATTDDEPLVGHVVVPGDAPGVEVVRTWDHLGLRASETHDVVYHDVEVPLENFRGVPVREHQEFGDGQAVWSLAVTALYVGVARAAQEFFVQFAHERVPAALAAPIAVTERVRAVSGEIEVQLVQAEETLLGLARRLDAGDTAAAARAPAVKLVATRSAIAAVETAVAALGNPALTRHHRLERHLRDVLCARVHPPQEDTALLALGTQALARHTPTRP